MLVDLTQIDLNAVETEIEGIRKVNQQRYEMEMLSGIIKYNPAEDWVVAYLDTSDEDFWVRGHVPGRPLMPGVLMCECAAQACSFCYGMQNNNEERFLGFYGLDNVRFRGQVLPGDRLIMVARLRSAKSRITFFDCQGFVNGRMVFAGQIQGVAL
jgi:3-hydroxyacyl-[acyl-carrier-protein] dehydratase